MNKIMNLFAVVMMITIIITMYLATNELRNEVMYLREWKSTYENGYCPVCGHAIVGENDE